MPPDSDGDERTVRCHFEKSVPDVQIVHDLRTIVARAHEASIYVSELLNIYVRQQLEETQSCKPLVFNNNELRFAFQSVVHHHHVHKVNPVFQKAFEKMPSFEPVNGAGMEQVFQYIQNNMAATATTNVWYHFKNRMYKHIKFKHGVDAETFKSMSKEDRNRLKLHHLQITTDMLSMSNVAYTSQESVHEWITSERKRLHIHDFLLTLPSKQDTVESVMKKHPEKSMWAMSVMSSEAEANGGKAFAIYPLRRHLVVRFIHFDERALNSALQATRNERLHRKRKLNADEVFTFDNVIDIRASKLCQRWRVLKSFDTDGVSIHFKQLKGSKEATEEIKRKRERMHAARAEARKAKKEGRERVKPEKKKNVAPVKPTMTTLPKRGIYAIDTIKHLSRKEYHVIGIDPGKHNLVQAVDPERPKSNDGRVRYTLKERQRDMRTRQYCDEAQRGKHPNIQEGEEQLSRCNSRSVVLDTFVKYCLCRRCFLKEALQFYGQLDHRCRRWKRAVKTQKSEQKLYDRLASLKTDERPLVLAYGSWGLTSGKGFKGLPPCIGVGLIRKLAKQFVVVPTPEHYTSKTCVRCFSECGAHPTLKREIKERQKDGSNKLVRKEIRGLRVCQNESCKLFMNRDHAGACNIATNFSLLVQGSGTIRQLNPMELELNRLECSLCTEE